MTTDTVPEIAASKWSIDLAHSSVHFKVRHMGIAWVRGELRILRATMDWSESNVTESHIDVEIDPASVNTGEPQRDQHLRSESFLDVARISVHAFPFHAGLARSGQFSGVDGRSDDSGSYSLGGRSSHRTLRPRSRSVGQPPPGGLRDRAFEPKGIRPDVEYSAGGWWVPGRR